MAKAGRKADFQVAAIGNPTPTIVIGAKTNKVGKRGITISLQHYHQEAECFSAWGQADLKKFSATVGKLRNYSADELRQSDLCDKHKTKPGAARFRRPDGIGKDQAMFEIRVDRNNLARIHGVFEADVFHLVWLDSKHRVFPS